MKIPSTIGRRRAFATVAPAVSLWAILAGSCDSEPCMRDQIECHGNEVWTCLVGEDMPAMWAKVPCGDHRYCRIGSDVLGRRGTCAIEPEPEPSCAAATLPAAGARRLSACTSAGRAVACEAGYVNAVVATCASPELCVSTTPPVCVATKVPDARCPASAGYTTTCAGDHALTCADGYFVEDKDCGPGLCDTTSLNPPSKGCLASRTPDPRCTAIAGGVPAGGVNGCEDNVLFQCLDSVLVSTTDCGPDYCVANAVAQSANCRYDRP